MIRHDMPERDYHAHPALNASTLKAVHKYPLKKVRHDLDNRPGYNPAFTLGSAAHRLILEGNGDGIVLIDKPDYRTKEARVSRDAALAAGSIPLLPHEHEQVDAMCAAVKEDDTAGPLLTGHQPEVSVFADLYGQPCKARLDAWHQDDGTGRPLIVDLKTTQDADPETFARTALTYGYGQQQAHYMDIIAKETGREPRFLFVLVEKQAPYLVSVVELDNLFVEVSRQKNREAAEAWKRAKESDSWPGYEGISRVLMPAWGLDDVDEEISL